MSYTVPTFAADGRRLRNYTPEAIEHLLSLSLVAVERGRKDRIKCAFFRPTSGASPVRPKAHMGTKYSSNELLPSGHHSWKHRRLLQSQHLEEILGVPVANEKELDRFLQSVFRAVPLSCLVSNFDGKPEMTPAAEQQPKAAVMSKADRKVVAIDSFAARRYSFGTAKKPEQPNRPLEFDSQLRAA